MLCVLSSLEAMDLGGVTSSLEMSSPCGALRLVGTLQGKGGLPYFFLSSSPLQPSLPPFDAVFYHVSHPPQVSALGTSWTWDVETMFSREGIEASLMKAYGKAPPVVIDKIEGCAHWLLGALVHQGTFFTVSLRSDLSEPFQLLTTDRRTETFLRRAGMSVTCADPSQGGLWPCRRIHSVGVVMRSPSEVVPLLSFLNALYERPASPSTWEYLQEGDRVDLVAPSSRFPERAPLIKKIKDVFARCGLEASFRYAVQGKNVPVYYANTDQERARQLYAALSDPTSKAVMLVKGGAGASRLLPYLLQHGKPPITKPLIGFSDATLLHAVLNRLWSQPTLHGLVAELNAELHPITGSKLNMREPLRHVLSLLKGEKGDTLTYTNLSLLSGEESQIPESTTLFGGTLTLVTEFAASPIGFSHQPFTLILEDVHETPHQMERALDALMYSSFMQACQAVIFGAFVPAVKPYFKQVRQRFAQESGIPVFEWPYFGHGLFNRPLPLGTQATLKKGVDGYTLTVALR